MPVQEPEIPLDRDAFEAVRTGAAPAPLPNDNSSIEFRIVEVETGSRTGRWMVIDTENEFGEEEFDCWVVPVWPPLAACYSPNAAAARLGLEVVG